jgi:chemotaxis protein MotB
MKMSANAPVIIIKRKKVIAGGGHHGGAWKVAYADFVTAMMAFFLLMWLLNATTEQQRKGIADYFAPTIAINRISGGGDGMFGGTDIFSQSVSAKSGSGGMPLEGDNSEGAGSAQVAALRNIEEVLLAQGGESALSELALRHIVTRVTDEGLVIEIFDLPDAPLFDEMTSTPTQVTRDIAAMMARLFAVVENEVALSGFVKSQSVLRLKNPIWDLSIGRAEEMRKMLEDGGLDPARIARVTGAADRKPTTNEPMDDRNNRLEITLLRSDV